MEKIVLQRSVFVLSVIRLVLSVMRKKLYCSSLYSFFQCARIEILKSLFNFSAGEEITIVIVEFRGVQRM